MTPHVALPQGWEDLGGGILPAIVEAIPFNWLVTRRWFAGKSRQLSRVALFDHAVLSKDPLVALTLVEVHYAEGPAEMYALPLLFGASASPILTIGTQAAPVPVGDALDSPTYQVLLLRLLSEGARCGAVRFEPMVQLSADAGEPKPLGVEQSNTSVRYGRSWVLKSFRKIAFGENRDLEVGRFLTLEAGFLHTPQVGGAIAYRGRESATLGVLQRFVENEGDGWTYVRSRLETRFEEPPNAPDDVFWAQDGLPERDVGIIEEIEQLGRITGQMHLALGSRPNPPDFAPEPVSSSDVDAWLADLQNQRAAALASARAVQAVLPEDLRRQIKPVIHSDALARVCKIQIHGDYHLGQVLKTPDGFSIIDFEGEPARPLDERRAKQPPLRDVAGMLRSLHYVAHSVPALGPSSRAEEWYRRAGERFLEGWLAGSERQFVPDSEAVTRKLLALFQLTKAYYELNYELNNRPNWVAVPLRGIVSLLTEVE